MLAYLLPRQRTYSLLAREVLIKSRDGLSEGGRCTYNRMLISRTASVSLLTRGTTASYEMLSRVTLSTSLQLRDRLRQSKSLAYAKREHGHGGENGLWVHDC